MKFTVKVIGFCFVIFLCAYGAFFVRPYRISGDSMDPKLKNNTIILIDTLLPRIGILARSNIILYTHNNEIKIKRILGIGGENITIKEGKIYTNNNIISEPYLNPNLRTCVPGSCIDLSEKMYQVPEGSYFMLGDNRENSRDSRGCLDAVSCDEKAIYYVPKSGIIGKYIIAFPSFSK